MVLFLGERSQRSLYANRDIEKGAPISFDDIAAKRPFQKEGISPKDYKTVLGKVAKAKIYRNEIISTEKIDYT